MHLNDRCDLWGWDLWVSGTTVSHSKITYEACTCTQSPHVYGINTYSQTHTRSHTHGAFLFDMAGSFHPEVRSDVKDVVMKTLHMETELIYLQEEIQALQLFYISGQLKHLK